MADFVSEALELQASACKIIVAEVWCQVDSGLMCILQIRNGG